MEYLGLRLHQVTITVHEEPRSRHEHRHVFSYIFSRKRFQRPFDSLFCRLLKVAMRFPGEIDPKEGTAEE